MTSKKPEMTMTNSDDVENGARHLSLHCFDDHEKHPSMAHDLLIAINLITEDRPHYVLTRQDLFHLNNKHQLLSKRNSPRHIIPPQAVLCPPPG